MTHFALGNEFFAGRSPGCYNDPDFLALEAKDPAGVLHSYARFVLTREMSTVEATRVRAAVTHVVGRLLDLASPAEMMRNCFRASMVCLQTLEAAGIWGFVATGSVRFRFPIGSGIGDAYFYSNDGAAVGHKAGHAWLVVPPFQLIDITAWAQGWRGTEATLIPRAIIKESVSRRAFLPELTAPPELLKGFRLPPDMNDFWRVFSPFEVEADRVRIFYQQHGVTIPAEPLAEADFMLGGRPAARFVADEIQPGLIGLTTTPNSATAPPTPDAPKI